MIAVNLWCFPLPKDSPFTSTSSILHYFFNVFMPSTRNNEDYTKASLARRLSIAVPTLIPLMNNINNRISCHTSRKKG